MKIKFNSGTMYAKGGDKMNIMTLDSIDVTTTEKNKLPWLQMFNSGYRVTSENIDWNTWNGCVFIDIDSKHYYDNVRQFKVDSLFEMLYDYLQYNYNYYFYCIQKSNSKKGFHIMFYFDVTKNETNFNKCVAYANEMVLSAFKGAGAEDIIRYNNVLDKCSVSKFQGMYLTSHEIRYGFIDDKYFGRWETIDEYTIKAKEAVHKSDVKPDGTQMFKYEGCSKINNTVGYKEHLSRWKIYDALIAVFKTKEQVDIEWDNICKLLPEGNGHGYMFYRNEPNRNKWYDKYTSEYVNVNVLYEFGYKFQKIFEPIKHELFVPDIVIDLEEEQTLSDVDLPFREDKINYIYAGCGLGKTYMCKHLGINVEIDDWDFIMGKQNRWVCVISPMKSINKNSFENIDGWVIVDGDHKEQNEDEIGKFERIVKLKRNICTTWESFYMYGMNNIGFDYVIVDEIHTINMYDYRINSISRLKRLLPNSQAYYKVVMSGTPSNEVNEFDCYKIQVNKKQNPINTEIVFYNNSPKGYIIKDIKEWTKNKDHIALYFEDKSNYKTAEFFENNGLKVDVFNTNYKDTTEYILENENIKEQITCFSVFGQAGINIYLDTSKKARLYILSNNSLGIIQYANRIRNKEVIDKIIIPYKFSNISNSICDINLDIDYNEANRKLDILKHTKKDFDIFSERNSSIIELRYGFSYDCINDDMSLNMDNYATYKTIKAVTEYEKQIQIIYNRLVNSYMAVHFFYMDKDIKTDNETKMRNNQFAGQMKRFNCDMMKQNKRTLKYYLEPDLSFNKIITGNLKDELEYIFNSLYTINKMDYDITCGLFKGMINDVINNNSTIKRADITNIYDLMRLQNNWNEYYNNAFIYVMLSDKWNINKITAAYIRSIYYDGMNKKDLYKLTDEAYTKITHISKVVNIYKDIFINLINTKPCDNMNIVNDSITQEIYTYLENKHANDKKGKEIELDGIKYKSIKEASELLGISRQAVYKRIKKYQS